jgi:hypothetical protein
LGEAALQSPGVWTTLPSFAQTYLVAVMFRSTIWGGQAPQSSFGQVVLFGAAASPSSASQTLFPLLSRQHSSPLIMYGLLHVTPSDNAQATMRSAAALRRMRRAVRATFSTTSGGTRRLL